MLVLIVLYDTYHIEVEASVHFGSFLYIAGEWKEMLEKEGFTVSAQLEGLGQIPEIQEIFIDHIRFGLKHRMLDIMTKKAAYAAGKDTELYTH